MNTESDRIATLESRLSAVESRVFNPPKPRYHRGKTISFNLSLEKYKFLADLLETRKYKNQSELMRLAVDFLISAKQLDYKATDDLYGDDDMDF